MNAYVCECECVCTHTCVCICVCECVCACEAETRILLSPSDTCFASHLHSISVGWKQAFAEGATSNKRFNKTSIVVCTDMQHVPLCYQSISALSEKLSEKIITFGARYYRVVQSTEYYYQYRVLLPKQ